MTYYNIPDHMLEPAYMANKYLEERVGNRDGVTGIPPRLLGLQTHQITSEGGVIKALVIYDTPIPLKMKPKYVQPPQPGRFLFELDKFDQGIKKKYGDRTSEIWRVLWALRYFHDLNVVYYYFGGIHYGGVIEDEGNLK